MPTFHPITIQLPAPQPRQRGLLVDVATELTVEQFGADGHDRLGLGVQHTPWGCEGLISGSVDCSADFLLTGDGPAYDASGDITEANVSDGKRDAFRDYSETVEHPAFKVVDGLQCTTLSMPDDNQFGAGMTERLRTRMRWMMSEMLAVELINGWASGGISLSSEAEVLTASTGMVEGASAIEAHLATVLHNGAGTVFIPPSLLHVAYAIGWVRIEDGGLYTVSGHKVVSDAGHDGAQGPTDAAADTAWLFGTGEIGYRVSDTNLLGDLGSDTLDIGTNMRERLAEAVAQVAFDPCAVGAVAVGTAA